MKPIPFSHWKTIQVFPINWLSPKANPSVKFTRVITLVDWVRISAN